MMFKQQRILFIASLLLGAAAGLVVSTFQKPYVEASRSFMVQNTRHAAEKVYDYEGYYTLQTANEAAKALTSWLVSPGGVAAIYGETGIAKTFPTLKSYERVFSVRRADTPFFEVRFKATTQADAEKISAAIEKLLARELAAFQNSDSLSLGSSPPVAMERSVPYARNIFYGAFLAAALMIFVLLFRNALTAENAS